MSEPKVIYLGPACEADTGDGRTWAEDNPWPDCECGHRPVQYVLGETFERMKAERDALQLRLNAADQRIDELESVPALYQQVQRAAGDLPDGWEILICIEKGSGSVDLVDPDGSVVEFATNDERLDYTVSDAIDHALSDAGTATPKADADWHMNPCKQGHRDVGAAGGVAACNQCDEKIEAATTQEAFERWNATHPASVLSATA
ncbi:hypothetical protein [Pseudomonas sp.]|uniref:hypothetical protein n=1 Tax=Pseudomonas sp. TaxID=306 RepID=UPI002489F8B1|nr:hypothetical protein [Pseudomonas sp.]MDI1331266.1 hypothetical protein [Pseudomonas sp.]